MIAMLAIAIREDVLSNVRDDAKLAARVGTATTAEEGQPACYWTTPHYCSVAKQPSVTLCHMHAEYFANRREPIGPGGHIPFKVIGCCDWLAFLKLTK